MRPVFRTGIRNRTPPPKKGESVPLRKIAKIAYP